MGRGLEKGDENVIKNEKNNVVEKNESERREEVFHYEIWDSDDDDEVLLQAISAAT